jgi:hypothetical protein
MRKITIFMIVFGLGILLLNSYSWSQRSSEWELEVKGDNTDIHVVPDKESTVVISLPKGFVLKSYEKTNGWFRIIIGPDEDGIVTIGYIESQKVDVIRKKIVEELDYWEEESEFFEGIGLSLKVTAGPTFFSGGDIKKGDQGLYDAASDIVSSYGFIMDRRFENFDSGFEVLADVVYNLNSKLGMGIGFGYIHLTQQSLLIFHQPNEYNENQMGTSPKVTAYPIRLGVFYNFPLHRLINLNLNSGVSLYFTHYSNTRFTNWHSLDLIKQQAHAMGFGLHGGLGVEINFNPRASFILEGRGRYAKISGFEGKSSIRKSLLPPLLYEDIEEKGTLYYLEGEGRPLLAVLAEEPTGYRTVRKAVLDLSGFIFQTGLRVKF